MKRRCGLCHRLFDNIHHGKNCPECGGYGYDAVAYSKGVLK